LYYSWQCGREYHVSCLKGSGADDLNVSTVFEPFCQYLAISMEEFFS
jgi:hypothetical protein